ncbi:methyl-accepting chemotaxis protein [Reinekea blandensis]|uniref:Methyl-accepting chemotaxis protein n=1 Tax=Reinekea blandensis MED297 TaxID=314283 RepID=A4B9N1_9GAMM|nr:methyl-accepting chemotaxis protein [Reinekea blandensis]EAR11332.1 Methyl-accepting chemotaxis protein [Reinekea sp. MED297] [Reinekea blandensis MED297]
MNSLLKLSIRTRLLFGFGIPLTFLILLNIQGIQKVNFIDRTLTEMTDINSVKQRYAINFRGSVHDRAIAIRDVAITDSPAQRAEFVAVIRDLERFYTEADNNMQTMISRGVEFSQTEQGILQKIDDIQSRTLPLVEDVIRLKQAGADAQTLILNDVRPAFIAWLDAINEFIDYQEDQNQVATPEARKVTSGFENLMLILTAIAIVISIIVGYLIARSLRMSLGGEPYEAQRAIQAISQGDMTVQLHTQERGSMLDSLSDMTNRITEIVRNISAATAKLTLQANEVSEGSSQVLQAARLQGEQTESTAQALETMRESINQVSEAASRNEEDSATTSDYAKQGSQVVNGVAREMETISDTVDTTVEEIKKLDEQTQKISGITSTINQISEQTNLLALNAAIEAARAGESGRGFAVVADEVRQLAQRTSEATQQIESMLGDVQAQVATCVNAMETTQPLVEHGRSETQTATQLLSDIEAQAVASLARAQEVVRATKEQVDGVNRISQTMEEVAAMSTQTIESMSGNEDAARTLKQLSEQLRSDIEFFRV